MPAPERYAGDLGTCKSFLMQCSLIFDQQPSRYVTDRAKVAFMMGSMTGRALAWATSIWESQSPILSSYQCFSDEMRRVFDHPVRGKDVASRLLSLRQGSRSVAEFAIDFRTIAQGSGWSDASLQGVFLRGLNNPVREELALRDDSESLEALTALAVRLESRLGEFKRERPSRLFNSPASRSPPPPPPRRHGTGLNWNSLHSDPTTDSHARHQTSPDRPALHHPAEEPMQLGRTRLTPEERQRRLRDGRCIYCGQRGHLIASCPLKDQAHQ